MLSRCHCHAAAPAVVFECPFYNHVIPSYYHHDEARLIISTWVECVVAPSGLLKKPEYKFVRMQFAMAALSTGYLLDLAEKKGIFYDAASLYSDILGDYIHDGKIKDRFEDLTKLFPAGKFMSEAAVGKVKAMGSQFRNVMLEEIGAPSAFSDIDDWGSGRMHDIMEESPDELMLTMASILRTSLMNSETIVDDVLRILDLSGDGTAPDSTIGDYSHMINKGLRV